MARIVVLGSIARDEVVQLATPLRGGTHVQGTPIRSRLGGGGANAAIALAHAGHDVPLVAAVGNDPLGAQLLAEVSRHGVDTGPVTQVSGPSTRSLVLLDPLGERTIVNLTRAREAKPPRRLLDLAADCVYVRSNGQDLAHLLAEKARLCPVIAQLRPESEGMLPVQVLVGSGSDLDAATLEDPWSAGRRLAGGTLQWVIVTHGGEGAEAHGAEGRILRATAPEVEVVDTTGAGDAFAAGLAHGLALGLAMEQALPLAVAWGAAKVACPGSSLDRASVSRLLREWTGRSSPNRP